MKSNQPNTSENPSLSSIRDKLCFEIDPTVATLEAIADDGRSYLLPYAQLLYAERISNPALEREPDAPPEQLRLHFAGGDVVLLGSGLRQLGYWIQKCELKFAKSVDRRLAPTLHTHIAAVKVTLTRENV